MGCDSYKDRLAAENREAQRQREAETERVEVYGHSVEMMQDLQRHRGYAKIVQYLNHGRYFLFRPVTLRVESETLFFVSGETADGHKVEIEFDSRRTRSVAYKVTTPIGSVQHWPQAPDAETAPLEGSTVEA